MNKSGGVRMQFRWLAIPLAAVLLLSGCFGGKKKHTQGQATGAEPDKVLYERAQEDIKHGRHTVGRLTLQTLINTYPDSDYLAKAKLAIADSFYKEGGTSGLTQAVEEYKNFIIFFPFLPEATYAQLQVAMTHYRRMEKPDRDRTDAKLAEEEFQTFLQKYPNDKLAPDAEQRLRDVQEVLAEGDYRIGRYYYIKGSLRAAAGRLSTLSDRYPLYSRADQANWMLADIYARSEHKEIAAKYWARIVREYPLSSLVANAKDKLKQFGAPIPPPDVVALARAQKEREFERRGGGVLHKATGILTTRPDVATAARLGEPNMTPASVTGGEILTPGGTTGIGGEGGASTSAVIATVQPGAASTAAATGSNPSTDPAATDPANSSSAAPANPPSAANPPDTTSPGAAKPNSTSPDAQPASTPSASPSTSPNAPSLSDAAATNKSKSIDKNKESTSKKKKGLRKIVPW